MADISLLTITWYVIEWILRIAAVFVVPRNRKPTSGMAWLMFIFLIPPLGWLLFLIIGSNKLPKDRRDTQELLDEYIDWQVKQSKVEHPNVFGSVPKKYSELARLAESLTHLPVMSGTKIEPLAEYDETIQQIVADIEKATTSVYVEYYIIALDKTTEPFFRALRDAVRRGVDVRVLYDAWGVRKYPRFREMKQRLTIDGVRFEAMLPLTLPGKDYVRPDLRNHRKLVVIDSRIGYTGSQNLIDRTYHRKDDIIYDELTVRLEGPVALQLEAVFLTDWHTQTGELPTLRHASLGELSVVHGGLAQVLPSGPGYQDENNLKVFTSLMYDARHSITIVNPYFVPSESLILALTSAARRGVKVTMINSDVVDQRVVAHAQRSYYEEMLDAGVDIYLYKAPVLLHAKFIVVDDDIALVGSSNMDIRSFELNHELTLLSYDSRFAHRLAEIAATYKRTSRKVNAQEWRARRWYKKLLDNLARLTSALQ